MHIMNDDYHCWPLDQLIRYVSREQHLKMNQILTELQDDFRTLAIGKGQLSPCLCEVQRIFARFADDLKRHLSKEAAAVFPFVIRYTKELKKNRKHRKPGLHSACFPVDQMYKEHQKEKEYLNLLVQRTNPGTLPESERSVYTTICTKLLELKKLWEKQVSLENNIVFPRLIEMEATLTLASEKYDL